MARIGRLRKARYVFTTAGKIPGPLYLFDDPYRFYPSLLFYGCVRPLRRISNVSSLRRLCGRLEFYISKMRVHVCVCVCVWMYGKSIITRGGKTRRWTFMIAQIGYYDKKIPRIFLKYLARNTPASPPSSIAALSPCTIHDDYCLAQWTIICNISKLVWKDLNKLETISSAKVCWINCTDILREGDYLNIIAKTFRKYIYIYIYNTTTVIAPLAEISAFRC